MSSNSAIGALIGIALAVVGAAALVKIIDDSLKSKRYVCPECGRSLRMNQKKCPDCGTYIRWA